MKTNQNIDKEFNFRDAQSNFLSPEALVLVDMIPIFYKYEFNIFYSLIWGRDWDLCFASFYFSNLNILKSPTLTGITVKA